MTRLSSVLLTTIACMWMCVMPAGAATSTLPAYHLVMTQALPGDGGWDYLTVDSQARRLFISRSTHVMVVDIDSGKVVGDIPDTTGVHGIAVDHKSGHGFTSNGQTDSVTVFDLKTLAKIAEIPVGKGPDAIVFDSFTDRVFTFNGKGQSITAIDVKRGTAIGTFPTPGRPEAAVADGRGHIYDNIEDKNEIIEIDAKALTVTNTWSIAPGEGPSGLAMDTKNRLLFSVCDNQKMMIVNADTGKVVAVPAIGAGPDASAYDAAERLVFSPNGRDGTLTVIKENGAEQFDTIGTIPTQVGARTIALDEKTHRIITVTAAAAPPAPGDPPHRRKYVPGSFVMLEYGP